MLTCEARAGPRAGEFALADGYIAGFVPRNFPSGGPSPRFARPMERQSSNLPTLRGSAVAPHVLHSAGARLSFNTCSSGCGGSRSADQQLRRSRAFRSHQHVSARHGAPYRSFTSAAWEMACPACMAASFHARGGRWIQTRQGNRALDQSALTAWIVDELRHLLGTVKAGSCSRSTWFLLLVARVAPMECSRRSRGLPERNRGVGVGMQRQGRERAASLETSILVKTSKYRTAFAAEVETRCRSSSPLARRSLPGQTARRRPGGTRGSVRPSDFQELPEHVCSLDSLLVIVCQRAAQQSSIQDQVTHALWDASPRMRSRLERPATCQTAPFGRDGIRYLLEILHPGVERDIRGIPVERKAATSLVVTDKVEALAQAAPPVPPHRALIIILEMAEPVRGLESG